MDPYFAAPKMAWLRRSLDLPPGGDVVVTTIDAWVNYRLAGAYATDLSTASRTQLLDGESLQWSERAAEIYGLPLGGPPRARALRRDARDHDRASVRRCPSPG